jgi:ABC-2 type transport system permease protein
VFKYSPKNGLSAYPELLIIMSVGILVFLSIGYLIAGIAKTEETASPLANLAVFPQLILSGTFFPIQNLPFWIVTLSGFLPLTYLNQAMRAVSLEGYHLWDLEVLVPVLIMLLWIVICFGIASKSLKISD